MRRAKRAARRGVWLFCCVVAAQGCLCEAPEPEEPDAGEIADATSPDEPADAAPEEDAATTLEDAGDVDDAAAVGGCPFEMVRVARRFCVDRFEASLVDHKTGRPLSPYYPPSRRYATMIEKQWERERLQVGDQEARNMPLPALPDWQRQEHFSPRAVSRRGAVPHGYTSGELAAKACANAGKRLCTIDEWRLACRGEQDRQFPYGTEHVQGKCNMHRESHPAVVLHDNASKGHLDPRLNQVAVAGRPLLRKTGDTPSCVSEWEGDGIFDMVGNLDEWVDDPEGTFLGGFYSRAKKDGCESTVRFHPIEYFDYSTGTRCCTDLGPPEPPLPDQGPFAEPPGEHVDPRFDIDAALGPREQYEPFDVPEGEPPTEAH
jgi:hypothetical protein